jgi:hypothetical protein
MLDGRGGAQGPAVEGGLHIERILWRRVRMPHHYVGTLEVGDSSIRLDGEDPATGIEVSLAIPFSDVKSIRMSSKPTELVVGEQCVVVEFDAAEAICLVQAGTRPASSRSLSARMARLVGIAPAPSGRAAERRRSQ